jgi:hypothetical protein
VIPHILQDVVSIRSARAKVVGVRSARPGTLWLSICFRAHINLSNPKEYCSFKLIDLPVWLTIKAITEEDVHFIQKHNLRTLRLDFTS